MHSNIGSKSSKNFENCPAGQSSQIGSLSSSCTPFLPGRVKIKVTIYHML